MEKEYLKVYLAGEIHTDWRDIIKKSYKKLRINLLSPVTDHAASDDCGVKILGEEKEKFWHDYKGAENQLNKNEKYDRKVRYCNCKVW